jgi:hypothetical protein
MNLGQRPEWLPLAIENFEDRLWLRAWRNEWQLNLATPKFAAEYGCYTDILDDSLSRLLTFLHQPTIDGHPIFIDWDQAAFDSFYLNLPNYFSVETALCYRDALGQLGLDIHQALFMEHFHEIGRYMGLRYLEVGLQAWRRHYFQESNSIMMHFNKRINQLMTMNGTRKIGSFIIVFNWH